MLLTSLVNAPAPRLRGLDALCGFALLLASCRWYVRDRAVGRVQDDASNLSLLCMALSASCRMLPSQFKRRVDPPIRSSPKGGAIDDAA